MHNHNVVYVSCPDLDPKALRRRSMMVPAVIALIFILVETNIFSAVKATKSAVHNNNTGALLVPHSQLVESPHRAQFAYAWLLGGVHPDRPGYKGFLFNILISMYFMRHEYGSKADFVVYIQLSPDAEGDAINATEADYLANSGARVIYIPKPDIELFGLLTFEKLRPLELIEYERVQFLDGDLLPMASFDYIFELSVGPDALLAPNMIFATRGEPCNAGWFMLEPRRGAFEKLQKKVATQLSTKFDFDVGWGHSFRQYGDNWQGTQNPGYRWNFHGAHLDQGLIYYYVKYEAQKVSIALNRTLQRWGPGPGLHYPVLMEQRNSSDVLDAYSRPDPLCNDMYGPPTCPAPYRDFVHFYGRFKPWSTKRMGGRGAKWYKGLEIVNTKFQMGLDLNNWGALIQKLREPPLGLYTGMNDMANHTLARNASTGKTNSGK